MSNVSLVNMRRRVLEISALAGRGHIGPALSILDILDVLYGEVMNDVREELSPKRDRFILSKGHGCLALYVVLEKYGLIGDENLESFCSFNSAFGGHPEHHRLPAIEFSTGSLGHGPSLATGLAIGARLKNHTSRIYVLVGDGEINEGSVWEAAVHAKKHQLNNLCVIVDRNEMQASGRQEEVLDMEPLVDKWESFGFLVTEVDGHDRQELYTALNFLHSDSEKPQLVIARTVKGKGVREAEHSPAWHHKAKISREDIDRLMSGIY